jgi:putative peptidoglycan lipid II flippase
MLRDVVIAHVFGMSGTTDAYTAAFKLPDLLMYLIAGGALASTFVPVFSEYLKENDDRGAWKTFSVVATVTFVVATTFVIVAEIFAPFFIRLMNPGFYGVRLDTAVGLTRIVLPAQIFFLVGSLFMGTLNARNQFLIPTLGPTIYNVGIIVGAFMHLGIYGLMWGALAGAFVGNFALQFYQVVGLGMRYRPSFDLRYPGAVKVWKLLLPILLGVSLPNVDQIISGFFGSELRFGSQTALNYATRLMLIPIGIFAQAMGIAFLPTMSQQAGNLKQFRSTAARALRFVLFLTVPSSALMFILAVPIIGLLYQHGKFTHEDTIRTAEALRFYAIGIFAWSAQAILTRGFYAQQDSRTPVISGTIMTAIFIAMSWYVVHFHPVGWGIKGLAMATSIAATLHMLVMYYFLSIRTKGLQGFRTLAMLVKLGIATVFLGASSVIVERLLQQRYTNPHVLQYFILVFGPAVASGIVFLGVSSLMKMEETKMLTGLVGRFSGRKAA